MGASAGLHLLAWLPPDLDEAEIIEAAGRSGIRLQGVGRRRPAAFENTGEEPLGGLIFGYGTLGERELEPAVERLAGVIERVRDGGDARRAPSA